MKLTGYTYIISLAIILVIHLAGLIGLSSSYKNYFVVATPFNLIILAVVLYSHANASNVRLIIFSGICLIGGWLLEAAGVHSKLIFGSYSYGDTLGIKLLGVPLLIGVNWFLLSYCLLCMTAGIQDLLTRVFMVAAGMTSFDLFMEPVAIRLGYWSWFSEGVPLQNYLAWFLISVAIAYMGISLKVPFQNRMALPVFGCLAMFFLILDIILFC